MNGILIRKIKEREGMFFEDYGGLMEDLSLSEMWGLDFKMLIHELSAQRHWPVLASGDCEADSADFRKIPIFSISLANLLDNKYMP
jgi:hypothetical protein